MHGEKRFDLPAEESYTAYHPDDVALFSPVAKKMILLILLAMFAVLILAMLVTMPVTIFPFLLIIFIIHQYRKMSKEFYEKQKRKTRR